MRSTDFVKTAASVGVVVGAVAAGGMYAAAAESFDCGADGHPDAATAKCLCTKGKVEVTVSRVSRCITPQLKPPKPTTSPPPPAPPGQPTAKPKPPLTCPPDMVKVPGGKYWTGTAERNNLRQAHVDEFCIDATEVTVADYEACVATGGCAPAAPTVSWEGISKRQVEFWSQWCNAGKAGRSDHPMNCIERIQATTFCEAIDKRLPTADEWEVAARGPEGRAYAWGSDVNVSACWRRMDHNRMVGAGTCPVRAHPNAKTPTGIFGMTGNVWELVEDGSYPAESIHRGGGWSDMRKEHAESHLRRFRNRHTSARLTTLGFRCAR